MSSTHNQGLLLADQWRDYALLDCGDGLKLEQWGPVLTARPDPQVIWPKRLPDLWKKADAVYQRSEKGGGAWTFHRKLPPSWPLAFRALTFQIRPTGFKHMGLFPEQAVNWDWLMARCRTAPKPARVLNLFGYTGGATVAAASVGATVCHVDAAAGMVDWCRDNARLSGLADAPIRYIVDDCLAFVAREIRRQSRYEGLIMDPPSFGRGKRGEIWKLEDQLWCLLCECRKLLADRPSFALVNAYTASLSPVVLSNMVSDAWGDALPRVYGGEVGLPVRNDARVLPCGIFCRAES